MLTRLTILVSHVRNPVIGRVVIEGKDRLPITCSKIVGEYRLAGCVSFVPTQPGLEHLVGEYPLGGS